MIVVGIVAVVMSRVGESASKRPTFPTALVFSSEHAALMDPGEVEYGNLCSMLAREGTRHYQENLKTYNQAHIAWREQEQHRRHQLTKVEQMYERKVRSRRASLTPVEEEEKRIALEAIGEAVPEPSRSNRLPFLTRVLEDNPDTVAMLSRHKNVVDTWKVARFGSWELLAVYGKQYACDETMNYPVVQHTRDAFMIVDHGLGTPVYTPFTDTSARTPIPSWDRFYKLYKQLNESRYKSITVGLLRDMSIKDSDEEATATATEMDAEDVSDEAWPGDRDDY